MCVACRLQACSCRRVDVASAAKRGARVGGALGRRHDEWARGPSLPVLPPARPRHAGIPDTCGHPGQSSASVVPASPPPWHHPGTFLHLHLPAPSVALMSWHSFHINPPAHPRAACFLSLSLPLHLLPSVPLYSALLPAASLSLIAAATPILCTTHHSTRHLWTPRRPLDHSTWIGLRCCSFSLLLLFRSKAAAWKSHGLQPIRTDRPLPG